MRIVGSARPTHVAGLVALAPGGSDSEYESALPPTFCVALPETTFTPPDSVPLGAPGSKSPPGAAL